MLSADQPDTLIESVTRATVSEMNFQFRFMSVQVPWLFPHAVRRAVGERAQLYIATLMPHSHILNYESLRCQRGITFDAQRVIYTAYRRDWRTGQIQNRQKWVQTEFIRRSTNPKT